MWSRGMPYLWIFLCQDGNHAPHLSRCQRRSGATVCFPSWLLKYYFGAFFLLTSVVHFWAFWVPHRTNLKLHKSAMGFKPGKFSYCFPPFTIGIRNQQSLKITYMQEYLDFFYTWLHFYLWVTFAWLSLHFSCNHGILDTADCWCWSPLSLNSWF